MFCDFFFTIFLTIFLQFPDISMWTKSVDRPKDKLTFAIPSCTKHIYSSITLQLVIGSRTTNCSHTIKHHVIYTTPSRPHRVFNDR